MGLGMTHGPMLYMHDADMPMFLRRTLSGKRVPERLKDPRNWPAAMRAEWAADEGAAAARAHRERCHAANRKLRARLDAFNPDLVLIFGDDQYENFVEDIVPPFCIYILEEMLSRPFDREAQAAYPLQNIWNEGPQTEFRHRGHADAARCLARHLAGQGVHLPYAYRLRHRRGLAHAFINTLMFLDLDRSGFDYPVLPFHVNCYGGSLVRMRGGSAAPGDGSVDADPPAPSPAACFDVGGAVARAFAGSPWRAAMIASSSWSHAFLTAKNDWIFPDHAADRGRLAELRAGRIAGWRDLETDELEDAGQHELLNWITLAGAMSEIDAGVEIVDYVETHLMNSNKCFAVFSASARPSLAECTKAKGATPVTPRAVTSALRSR